MSRLAEMQRAESAYARVREVSRIADTSERAVYARRSNDLAAMILSDGLGQTLAYLRSKAKNRESAAQRAHYRLYQDASAWVMSRQGFATAPAQPAAGANPPPPDLLSALMTQDVNYYRRATVELLAYATWLKRFVEAELGAELEERVSE